MVAPLHKIFHPWLHALLLSFVAFHIGGGLSPIDVRPALRWAQTNSTVSVVVDVPKSPKLLGCGSDASDGAALSVTVAEPDRLRFSGSCGAVWDLELREDILASDSRQEALPSGSLLLTLRKQIPHRWDRLLQDEANATVHKDWKREDGNLPEEDEIPLPKAQNIKHLSFAGLQRMAKERTVVVAMRYPWCAACEEKNMAFVKATKVVGGKDKFAAVAFAALDLREEKAAARLVRPLADLEACRRDRSCPLFVFKPDEPLEEPYLLEVHLLYEMDEHAMLADPMMGAPGHTPRGQTAKPNFERFEQDLALLLPPALTRVRDVGELAAVLQGEESSAVVALGVNATELRRAARGLRGVAAVALAEEGALLRQADTTAPAIELWTPEAQPEGFVKFNGSLAPLAAEDLDLFVRVHTEPLVQNYSWELRDRVNDIGLPLALLWVNYSDSNSTNITQRALEAFRGLCGRRRGVRPRHDVLCLVKDESGSYHQREYGNQEPYPYPFFGLTHRLGFGATDRFAYPFREPVNSTVRSFFSSVKRASRQLGSWVGKVLAGQVPPSHESGRLPEQPRWLRGQVLEVVWKTYQKEINGSTADVLLELYDDRRKQASISSAMLHVVAATLKDYSSLKVARMEVGANYVPPIFGRKQAAKETEYYWVPPSLSPGEWTPELPVRYSGLGEVSASKLLRFLKKHSLSHWSLKEALEVASDLEAEVMGQAKAEQRETDLAEQEKQEMIKKMMTSLKKEKGLVDVGEMLGYKKMADAMDAEKSSKEDRGKASKGGKKDAGKASKKGKGAAKRQSSRAVAEEGEEEDPAEAVRRREERRRKLLQEEERLKEADRKEKERRRKRREEDKKRREKKKEEELARASKRREEQRKKREEERARTPSTPLFAWGQSRDSLHLSVSVPQLDAASLNVTISDDQLLLEARDLERRPFRLRFELREFVLPSNSSWSLRYSEANPLQPQPDGVTLDLRKALAHRWDRLAQNHSAVKQFLRKDWVQDDGDLEDEREDIDLPTGPNLKKVSGSQLRQLTSTKTMVMAALRYPWCDKCVEKDKHFAKAARTSRDKDHLDKVTFVVVDAREEKHLARAHNATCTSDLCELLIFKQDEPDEPYHVPGRRYSEETQIDCYKHILPVVSEVAEKDAFDRVTSAFDTAIVGFFRQNRTVDTWYPKFRAVARQLRGHALFGAIFGGQEPRDFGIEHDGGAATDVEADCAAGAAAHGADEEEAQPGGGGDGACAEPGRPLVLLFKPKENRHVEFTGELTLDKLSHFSRVLSLPLISTYEFDSRQKYQELKVPLGMLWLDGERPEREENAWALGLLRRLALRFSGHLVFIRLNSTRDAFAMRPMALDPRRVPAFGIASTDEPSSPKFGFDMQARSAEERRAFWSNGSRAYARLESFCASFLAGTLEASHESADLSPAYTWPGPGSVHEVVWKTFRDSVYRTEHHVLLELYSPFRPQHRTHLAVLDLVAEALGNATTVKVARMDTANNYVLPEFGLKDKEKASTFYFLRAAPELQRRPRRFAGRGSGRAEALPERLLRFVHREALSGAEAPAWRLEASVAWAKAEALRRIRQLKLLEKDYERKMQEEWMQKEMEEFERYKQLGKFDNLNL